MAERVWQAASVCALAVAVMSFLGATQWIGPAPDAHSYVQLSDSLVVGEYRVDIDGEPEGSRYPPGFPILLALLSPLADPITASLLMGAGLAVAAWVAARTAGGHIAATVAVLSIGLLLPRHRYAGAVMADLSGALVTVGALIAVQRGRHRLAGVLVGFGAWVRLAHVALGVLLTRRAWPPFAAVCAGLAATKAAWGWGYASGQAQWSLEHIWSAESLFKVGPDGLANAVAYPLMVLGVVEGLTVPGAALLAGWAAWHRSATERRFAIGTVVTLLVVYIPYFFQDSRFMFPVAALVAIYSGVGVASLVGRLRRSGGGEPDLGTDLSLLEGSVASGGSSVLGGDGRGA